MCSAGRGNHSAFPGLSRWAILREASGHVFDLIGAERILHCSAVFLMNVLECLSGSPTDRYKKNSEKIMQ
jgi:hypothetical protein